MLLSSKETKHTVPRLITGRSKASTVSDQLCLDCLVTVLLTQASPWQQTGGQGTRTVGLGGGGLELLADAPSPPAYHKEGIMKLNLFQREHGSSLFLLTLRRVVIIFYSLNKICNNLICFNKNTVEMLTLFPELLLLKP